MFNLLVVFVCGVFFITPTNQYFQKLFLHFHYWKPPVLPKQTQKQWQELVSGYLAAVRIVISHSSSWSYSSLYPQWICSSHRGLWDLFGWSLIVSFLCPLILNGSDVLWVLPVEHKSRCTPFWKNSKFWTMWIETTCSFGVRCPHYGS